MTDKPDPDAVMELMGQPFSVCPGTVYAQIGWYAPEKQGFYRLTDNTSPAERLKPVYLYLGNVDSYKSCYTNNPTGTEPCE